MRTYVFILPLALLVSGVQAQMRPMALSSEPVFIKDFTPSFGSVYYLGRKDSTERKNILEVAGSQGGTQTKDSPSTGWLGVKITAAQLVSALAESKKFTTSDIENVLAVFKEKKDLQKFLGAFLLADQDEKGEDVIEKQTFLLLEKQTMVILVEAENYTEHFEFILDLGALHLLATGQSRPGGAFAIKSEPFEFKPKLDLSGGIVNTKLQSQLVGDASSGTFVADKKDSTGVSLTATYAGVKSLLPFFGFQRYFDLKLDAKLFTVATTAESIIMLSAEGPTDWAAPAGFLWLSGGKIITSQTANSNAFLWGFRMRAGDKRATGSSFVAKGKEMHPFYAEVGTDMGYTVYRKLADTDLSALPETWWTVRPYGRVGVFELPMFGGKLSGDLTYYWLLNRLGQGIDGKRWGEVFNVELSLGPDNSNFKLGVSGGRNPADHFNAQTPTYTFKYAIKY